MKPRLPDLRHLFVAFVAVVLFGCTDANVDLQQQIAFLKEELERAKAEKISSPPPPPAEKPATPDPETLKQNYEKSGRALRAALEKELSGVQLESFTLYQPKLEAHPHKSEFSMEFRTAGIKFSLDRIPVRGSVEGNWFFPSVDAIVTQIERVKAAAKAEQTERSQAPNPSSTAQQGRTPTGPSQSGARELSSPAAANKTIAIDWDNRAGSPTPPSPTAGPPGLQPQRTSPLAPSAQEAPTRFPRQQEPTQAPASQGAPNSVMPAQREVQIKF